MIKGAKYSDDRKQIHFTQDNNAIEEYNRKTNVQSVTCDKCGKKIYIGRSIFESCGPESASIAAAAYYGEKALTLHSSKIRIQPGDLIFSYMNNSLNYDYFLKNGIDARNTPGNRLIKLYKLAMLDLFSMNVTTVQGISFDKFIDIVSSGFPVQFCFREPGHYNTVVKADKENRIAYRVCPLPSLKVKRNGVYVYFNNNGGWLEPMTENEFNNNTWSLYNVYGEY